jgi:hypothetical protein
LLDLPVLGQTPQVVSPDSDDLRLWSVTTIIGCLDKPALVPWAAIKTAEAAVRQAPIWQSRLDNEGEDSAIEWLKQARFRRAAGQRSATELGTAVHKACEHKAIHGRYSDIDAHDLELRSYLVQFDQFLDHFQPEYVAAEVTVYHPTFGYAGTCDGIMEIDGARYIIDYKTTGEPYDRDGKAKGPYPEVAMQLAAYRYAEIAAVWRARQAEQFKRRYYLLSDTERELAVPVPEVDHGLVIWLTPQCYGVYPIRCDETIFDHFLACIDAARFVLDVGKTVIGNPLIPPVAFTDQGDPFAGLPDYDT